MLTFRKPTIYDIPAIRPYIDFSKNRACDNTLGCVLIWRDIFDTEFTFYNDTLLFKAVYPDEGEIFSMPLGNDVPGAIRQIDEYCKRRGRRTSFGSATADDIAVYDTYFKSEKLPEAQWSDYLYLASDLAQMKGKRYNGQRNHINFFKRTNPDWSFKELTEANAGDALRFYINSGFINAKTAPSYLAEQSKVIEVLENFGAYGLPGGAIYSGGSVIAFAIGEIVHDTLFVHIEKASPSVRGAYQMIVKEFAAYFGRGLTYINREDDAGDDGLRTSKLSYHPCSMVEKFTVIKLD